MKVKFEDQKLQAEYIRETSETKVPESSASGPDIDTPEEEQAGAAATKPSQGQKIVKAIAEVIKSRFGYKYKSNASATHFPEPSAPPIEDDNGGIWSPPYNPNYNPNYDPDYNPNNIEPPPYSEEDPNSSTPPSYTESKRF